MGAFDQVFSGKCPKCGGELNRVYSKDFLEWLRKNLSTLKRIGENEVPESVERCEAGHVFWPSIDDGR
jgi:hypothetical protein